VKAGPPVPALGWTRPSLEEKGQYGKKAALWCLSVNGEVTDRKLSCGPDNNWACQTVSLRFNKGQLKRAALRELVTASSR
jgi:hypothetical protein